MSLSLDTKGPDGLEFEVARRVPERLPARTRALDREGALAQCGIPMPEEIDVTPST